MCFRHCLPSAVMLQVAVRRLAITREYCRHIRTLLHASSYAKYSLTVGSVGDSRMWAGRSLSCGNWCPHTLRTRNSRRMKSCAWPSGMSHSPEPVRGLPLFQKAGVDRIWNLQLLTNFRFRGVLSSYSLHVVVQFCSFMRTPFWVHLLNTSPNPKPK